MFGDTLDGLVDVLAIGAAVLLTGVAIKLMDDTIDRRMDALAGVQTWAGRLGDGAMPYGMAALATALLIDAPLSGTLFLAAYSLGMAHDRGRTLPSGLSGWQESALALVAGAILGGPVRMAAALAVVVLVQCGDDLLDADGDRLRGHRSFVAMLGRMETALLGLSALIVATALEPLVTTAVISCTAAVEWASSRESHAAGRETIRRTR